jgi:small subunit ribosomal protein S17
LERGIRKTRIGTVVSDSMNKTIVVAVDSTYKHPLYKKILKKIKRYKAHDESNSAKSGDKVLISETRPLSRTKKWRLVEIIRKAE